MSAPESGGTGCFAWLVFTETLSLWHNLRFGTTHKTEDRKKCMSFNTAVCVQPARQHGIPLSTQAIAWFEVEVKCKAY